MFKKNTNYFYAVRISIPLAILSEIFIHIGYFLSASLYLVKEALIEIGCVVTSLVGWLVGWLVVTRVHCGQTVHPRPIVTMEH